MEKHPTLLPRTQRGEGVPLTPSSIPLKSTISSSISSATTITLQEDTAFIRVIAKSQDVYLKYGTGVTTATDGFHELILADSVQDFIIPSTVTQISVIEGAATATVIIIEKTGIE